MSNFLMLGGFLIVPIIISLQALPAYILQFLIVRFIGKQYQLILPAISFIVMLLLGLFSTIPAIKIGRISVLWLLYALIVIVVFQLPTLVLILIGKITIRTIPVTSEFDRMKTIDLE